MAFPLQIPSTTKSSSAHLGDISVLARITAALDVKSAASWIVLATFIGSAVAAWVHLHDSSIWYDEAITLLTTSGHAGLNWALGLAQFKPSANLPKIASELYQQDVHPPLYFWTLAIWRVIFGQSLEVARALSAVFTLGTLCLLYRLAKDWGMKWPYVPVVLYAVSAVGVRYAYNARPYAMVSFLIVLTMFLARKRSNWTGACAAASIATHYFAALCIAPILLAETINQWKTNRRWALVTWTTLACCCAPLIPLLSIHIRARPLQYTGFGAVHSELCALWKGAMESIMPSTWLPGWTIALLIASGFALLGVWWLRKRQQWALSFVYIAFLLAIFLLALATNKSFTKMPSDYYLGIAAPLLALLIGFGVSAFPKASPLLALALIAGTATGRPMTHTVDYRTMAQQMRSECRECPILVGVGYVGAIPACVLYEAKGMKVDLLEPNDTVQSAVQRMGDPQEFFLVPSNEPATTQIEQTLVHAYPAERKHGYFEIDVDTKSASTIHR
jgi:Dolichyl-phosphate-mannose-protein mannosyltransferase